MLLPRRLFHPAQAVADSLEAEKRSLAARAAQQSADLQRETRTAAALQQQVADLGKQVAVLLTDIDRLRVRARHVLRRCRWHALPFVLLSEWIDVARCSQ